MAFFDVNVEYGKCPLKMTDDELENYQEIQEAEMQESIRSGNLYFDEHLPGSLHIPFILTPHSAEMPKFRECINEKWKLPSPRIVLFVFSEFEGPCSDAYRKISKKLSKGLAYAINTTEMWLFSEGVDVGFGKDIGAEVEGQLSRRQSVVKGVQKNSTFPDVSLIGICDKNALKFAYKFQTAVTDTGEMEKFEINRYHNNFIVVEDTKGFRKGVAEFVLKFSEYLSKQSTSKRFDDQLPVMAILLCGKISQVDMILGVLKRGIPLIVLEGSDGLADLLAYAFYQNASCPEGIDVALYIESVLKPQVVNKINLLYPSLTESEVAKISGKIFDCIRYSKRKNQQFMTVLDLNDINYKPFKLSHLLLKALFRAKKPTAAKTSAEIKRDLLLTMDWSSVDVAVDEVFSKDRSTRFLIDGDLFFRALTKPHREEFVALFLSKGFVIHTFLNSSTLLSLFQNSLNREFFKSVVWESVLGFGTNVDITRSFLDSKLIILIEELTGVPSLLNSYELDWNSRCIYDDRSPEEAERKAMAVLVMWAILSQRVKLVKVLMQHSEQPIHLALTCSVMLCKLETYVADLSLKKEMSKQATEFSEMATSIMTACYESVPCRAQDVLNEKNRVWSFKALMELAAYAQNKMFLANPCCQKYLDNKFMGRIKIRDLTYGYMTIPNWLKIIFCAFFIFPMYLWIRFEEPKEKKLARSRSSRKLRGGKSRDDFSESSSEELSKTPSFHGKRAESSNFFVKIFYLWTAPITKFWVYMVFYCLFLAFFSLAVLWPGCGNLYLDFFASIWIATIIMDATYQAYILNKKHSSMPLAYKCLEIGVLTIFLFIYILGRLVYMESFITSYNMKVMLCVALLYFYYRLIFISLPISSELGPLLYRVKRMVTVDFMSYIRVTILIVISNGIVLHSIMYPEFPFGREMVRRAFYDSFISFFVVPLADKLQTPDPKCIPLKRHPNRKSFYGFDPETCRVGSYLKYSCQNPGVWPYIFALQYYIILRLIASVLLVALFTNTARKMEEEGKYIWKYQRYDLITFFSNRLTLPPPLNLITFAFMLGQFAFEKTHDLFSRYVLKHSKQRKRAHGSVDKLDEIDFRYWKSLALELFQEMKRERDEQMTVRERKEQVDALTEALNLQRVDLVDLDAQIDELMLETRNAHQYLRGKGVQTTVMERLLSRDVPQIFSRTSPYPGTNVERFPVSCNHVPWSCTWTSYDPISYTLPKEEFPDHLAPYVDSDIQRLRELGGEHFVMPNFNWNAVSVTPVGDKIDRMSWIQDKSGTLMFDLDSENLPKNPKGRTGLRGRGCLPRWGPNHYVYIIVTQWHSGDANSLKHMNIVLMETEDGLTLPGGFVHMENRYEVLRSLFVCEEPWKTPEDMEEYFKDPYILPATEKKESSTVDLLTKRTYPEEGFSAERVKLGYLDEAINTDQAWCEADVWHFHYEFPNSLENFFKPGLSWHLLDEQVLRSLPIGQAALVFAVAKENKALLEMIEAKA